VLQVLLPAEFRDDHWRLVLAWLHRGHEFNQTSWTQALDAFDLLKNAALLTSTGLIPFPVVYRQQVDDRYADAFIARLYAIEPAALARESVMAWSEVARRLEADLLAAGLFVTIASFIFASPR